MSDVENRGRKIDAKYFEEIIKKQKQWTFAKFFQSVFSPISWMIGCCVESRKPNYSDFDFVSIDEAGRQDELAKDKFRMSGTSFLQLASDRQQPLADESNNEHEHQHENQNEQPQPQALEIQRETSREQPEAELELEVDQNAGLPEEQEMQLESSETRAGSKASVKPWL